MPTQKQLDANRRNARQSTGPRTAQGKAASAMNGLKTGIYAQSLTIRGEDPAALEALLDIYTRRWNPTTPEEQLLVDTLVRADWQLRRLSQAEAQLWDYGMTRIFRPTEETSIGQVFYNYDRSLIRLQRLIAAAERSHRAALQDLQRIESARPEPEPEPDPAPEPEPAPPPAAAPQPIAEPDTSPEIGFVPSTPPAPASTQILRLHRTSPTPPPISQ